MTEPTPEPTTVDNTDAELVTAVTNSEPVTDESPSDVTEPDAEHGDGKARRDAAKYRTRLRETEAERDQLRDQLAGQRRAIIDHQATARGVDPQLLDAAGLNIDELLDDEGQHVDTAKVAEFVDATAKRFKVGQGFTPNRGQGQSGGPVAAPSMADAFRRR
jgi:hypothetical protein